MLPSGLQSLTFGLAQGLAKLNLQSHVSPEHEESGLIQPLTKLDFVRPASTEYGLSVVPQRLAELGFRLHVEP